MKIKLLSVVIIASLAAGCGSKFGSTGKGVAIGAVAGGLLGQVIGHNKTSTLIGAAVGSAIGGAIGAHLDSVAEDAQKKLNLNANGENIDKSIQMKQSQEAIAFKLEDAFMFEKGKSDLSDSAKQRLSEIGSTLVNIDDGSYVIFVTGNTDVGGGLKTNLPLSKDRAEVVSSYLKSFVQKTAIDSRGFASAIPLKGLDKTDILNRRTEIQIIKLDDKYQSAVAKRQSIEKQLENLLISERAAQIKAAKNIKLQKIKNQQAKSESTSEPELAIAKINFGLNETKYAPQF